MDSEKLKKTIAAVKVLAAETSSTNSEVVDKLVGVLWSEEE